MEVNNQLNPPMERMADFFGPSAPTEPFVMVNLLKFKERAEYADGSDSELSGAEAYARYGAAVSQIIDKLGGRSVYAGGVTGLMLGEVEEMWDMVALVEYPNSQAFQDMVSSPEYQAIHHHRDAGLAGQLNIRTKPGVL